MTINKPTLAAPADTPDRLTVGIATEDANISMHPLQLPERRVAAMEMQGIRRTTLPSVLPCSAGAATARLGVAAL